MIRIKLGGYVDESGKIMTKEELDEYILKMEHDLTIAIEALEFISAPKRSDGTYNRNREACGLLASEALMKIRGEG